VTNPATNDEPVSNSESDVLASEVSEEEAELSRLEADTAVIEEAMDQVDSGNLTVADEMITRIGDS
jgi:small-conductance mechanosensitive channel|tara:strand:- start:9626 stop:9823 length:198 start_codon:yes stop_codon:yes gene_type:complete